MQKKIKIKDISRRLNLSDTTVSLVLNNRGDQYGIKRDTQEKVLMLAKKLGYFDQKTEKSPIERTPGVIGVVVPSFADHPYMALSARFRDIFSSVGFGLSVIVMDSDRDRYVRLLSSYMDFYSGLVFIGDSIDDSLADMLLDAEYPFVVIGKEMKSLRINTVDIDRESGAEQLAHHIDDMGYKNILILSSSENKEKALTDALRQRPGLKYERVVLQTNVVDKKLDFIPIAEYLRPPFRTDMIISSQASIVFSLYDFLKSINMRVPYDVSIFSMEGDKAFESTLCSLSFMSFPYDEVANKASHILWQEIKNMGKSKEVQHLLLKPSVVLGNSSKIL